MKRVSTRISPFSSHLLRAALAILLAVALGAVVAPPSNSQGAKPDRGSRFADTVFVNGKVLLYEKHKRWAQAVAVDDGLISYVGTTTKARKLIGPRTEVVNLHGKTLMPGMVDGHAHGSSFTACPMGYEGGTVEQVLTKLKACLLREDQVGMLNSNLRLTATNLYLGSLVPPGTRLTRDILDRLSADPADDEFGTGTTRPIVVRDSHEFSTNSQAISNAGIDENTPDPVDGFIGRDANGVPNGLFADFSADWGASPPAPADSTYISRVQNVAEASRKGITSYLRPGGTVEDLATWQRVADDGLLTIRVNQAIRVDEVRGATDPAVIQGIMDTLNAARTQYDGYTSTASPGEIHVDSVKIGCDGVAEYPSQTASMLEPYNVNVGTPESSDLGAGHLAWRGALMRRCPPRFRGSRQGQVVDPHPLARQPLGARLPGQLPGRARCERQVGLQAHHHPPRVRHAEGHEEVRSARRRCQHDPQLGRPGRLHGRQRRGIPQPRRDEDDLPGRESGQGWRGPCRR